MTNGRAVKKGGSRRDVAPWWLGFALFGACSGLSRDPGGDRIECCGGNGGERTISGRAGHGDSQTGSAAGSASTPSGEHSGDGGNPRSAGGFGNIRGRPDDGGDTGSGGDGGDTGSGGDGGDTGSGGGSGAAQDRASNSCQCCVYGCETSSCFVRCVDGSECIDTIEQTCDPHTDLVPLLRYFRSDVVDHCYATDPRELGALKYEWVFERIEAYVLRVSDGEAVPYYRYWYGSHHFNSTVLLNRQKDGMEPDAQFHGYVYLEPGDGEGRPRVPLHHYFDEYTGDHVYTVDPSELGGASSRYVLLPDRVYVIPR